MRRIPLSSGRLRSLGWTRLAFIAEHVLLVSSYAASFEGINAYFTPKFYLVLLYLDEVIRVSSISISIGNDHPKRTLGGWASTQKLTIKNK